MLSRILSITQHWHLPAVCLLCKHPFRGTHAICELCHSLLQPIQQACSICRLALNDAHAGKCGYCIKKKPLFDQVFSAYPFEEPLRTLLHHFKYQNGLYLSSLIVKLMLDALPPHYRPTDLIPVPLHPKRLRQRGFNQAAELAKCLANQLSSSVHLQLCSKQVHTPTQVELNEIKRRQNLHHAFRVHSKPPKHVTLIDDLLTTGSTANELARVLKQQGTEQVDVWCLARTMGI